MPLVWLFTGIQPSDFFQRAMFTLYACQAGNVILHGQEWTSRHCNRFLDGLPFPVLPPGRCLPLHDSALVLEVTPTGR